MQPINGMIARNPSATPAARIVLYVDDFGRPRILTQLTLALGADSSASLQAEDFFQPDRRLHPCHAAAGVSDD